MRLERETGVSRTTINKWKTQPRPPQAATVNTVAATLNIDPVEALQLAGILPTDEPPAERDAQTVSWDELMDLIEDAKARDDRLIYDALMEVKRKRDERDDAPSARPVDKRGNQVG